jgi:hypothetical protein
MDKEYWGFKFITKISNNSKNPLILPSFRIRAPSAFQPITEAATGLFLSPGASCYQIFGGSYSVENKDHISKPIITFLDNDFYAPRTYADYQIANKSRMKIEVTSWQAYENGCAALQVQFHNETKIKVNSIDGTAIFLGADGAIVDGDEFEMALSESGKRELDIFDVPGSRRATKCYLQIDAFRDLSGVTPSGMPPEPSVK